jgi:DNA-binding transcriptional MerR regulator
VTDEVREEIRRRLDGCDYHTETLNVLEAAVFAGVSEDTIRQWKRRGHLTACDADEAGRPLFYGIDVLRAEAKTRHRARRRFPQAC